MDDCDKKHHMLMPLAVALTKYLTSLILKEYFSL